MMTSKPLWNVKILPEKKKIEQTTFSLFEGLYQHICVYFYSYIN